MSKIFKAGDKVRIINIENQKRNHPTENRLVINGDEVVVEVVVVDEGIGEQLVIWKPNKDGIYSRRCELVEPVCNCPGHVLIWGHLPGCPFKKENY